MGSGAHPVRIAGYQGPASILTASLLALAEQLRPAFDTDAVQVEANVPAGGESAAALFASVDRGARQICYIATGYLALRVPELAALDLPFTVRERSSALRALDGAAGTALIAAIEARTGYQVLGFWDNGFRHISNGVRPIRHPDDCAGLSIRTLDSAIYREALAALGFRPVSIDVKHLVRVVQTREVDAQENPLTNYVNFDLSRYHRHVSLSGHFFGVLALVCNRAWFASLTPLRQEALVAAAANATALQRTKAAGEDEGLMRQLRGQGVLMLEAPDLDLEAMKQATRFIVEREARSLSAQMVSTYLDEVMR